MEQWLKTLRKSRLIAWVTLAFFIMQPITLAAVVIVDPSNPEVQVQTVNGVDVVNIANPTGNGLSHNKYTDFNVGPNGLILNNGRTNTNTELAGMINANANLTGNSARIILNEVTSQNISHLNGMIEVGGQRADVVIANANGIVGSGFGFINTNRATLTTGSPMIENGNLTGFDVAQGSIQVGSDGMANNGLSRVDFLSRAMEINGAIYASEINGITGTNQIDYPTLAATAYEGDPLLKPQVAIDVAVLGGMYAQRIVLVGTEKGVGVNSAGALSATGGNVTITTDGKIILKDSSKVAASANITLTSEEGIANAGELTAGTKVTLDSAETLNQGAVFASNIQAQGEKFQNSGDKAILASTGNIQFAVTEELRNSDQGLVYAQGNVLIGTENAPIGKVVNESATISAENNIVIHAGELINQRTEFETKDVVTTNQEVELKSGNPLGLSTNQLANGEYPTGTGMSNIETTVIATETTTTTTEVVKDSGAGVIQSGNQIVIQADHLRNDKSNILADKSITIQAGQFENVGYELQQKTVSQDRQVVKRWVKGHVYDTDEERWVASGNYESSKVIVTPGAVTTTIDSLGTVGGLISAGESLTIQSDVFENKTTGSLGAATRSSVQELIGTPKYLTDSRYQVLSDPDGVYIMQTKGHLGNSLGSTSSELILSELEFDLETSQKRLGDGLYEQEIVKSQILDLTGKPFLNTADINVEYKELLKSGVLVAEELGLLGGIPLTTEQIEQLDKDIVWMEEREFEGEKVLVPVLYLAQKEDRGLRTNGALLTASQVTIEAQDFKNQGVLEGNQLKISSDQILNDQGRILATDLQVQTDGDIVNRNGEIHSKNSLNLTTVGNIISETTVTQYVDTRYDHQQNAATPSILSSDGSVTLKAGGDIHFVGGGVIANENVILQAQNITSDVVKESNSHVIYTGGYSRGMGIFIGGNNQGGYMDTNRWQNESYETGTLIAAGKNVAIQTQEEIHLKAAAIQANENILLYSVGNTTITAGQNTFNYSQNGYHLGAGLDKVMNNPTTTSNNHEHAKKREWNYTESSYGKDVVSPELLAGGKIQLLSEQSITLNSAQISSLEGIDVIARGDVEVLAEKEVRGGNSYEKRSKTRIWNSWSNEYAAGSHLVSDGDIRLIAGYTGDFGLNPSEPDSLLSPSTVKFQAPTYYDFEENQKGRLRIQGSAIASNKGKVSLEATKDVVIESINLVMKTYSHSITKSSSLLSSKRTTRTDSSEVNYSQGSQISGDSVEIKAGGDLTVSGSDVFATHDVDLTAGGDVNIVAAKNTSDEYHMLKVEKSGLMSGGTLAVSIGKEKEKTTEWSHDEFYTGSSVGSLLGNVNITAGSDVNVVGSDVTTLVGDINIEGENVNIASAVGQGDSHYRYEYEKTGLTIGLGGTLIDPIKMAYDYSQVSKDAQTDELRYAAGAKAVWETRNAVQEVGRINQAEGLLDKYNEPNSRPMTKPDFDKAKEVGALDKDGNLKESGDPLKESISINISLGTQKTSAKQDTVTQTASGSNLSAGGDINIIARGKGDGEDNKEGGDINIVGSTISGDNVTLVANEDVNILAAQNTQDMTGSNKSSSASVGVSVNLNGDVSFNASVSGGKGKSNGQVVENVESTVTARDTLTIESGKDTNIIGSQVAGNTVVADIGGDLNIESLQDKDNYHEKNSNWNAGGSISATGVPSFSGGASNQKIDSEYKSVQEQAGIYAGTGGFDITVGGNTDLKGAVIDSQADADKNKLSTDTITYSDIKNEAEWSAETKGANVGLGGGTADKDKGTTPNFAGSEDEESSTTKSAIAPSEIEIRSDESKEEKDKTDLSDLSREPEKANNPLDKIFDKDKILEKQEAAALFGEIGFTLAGDLAEKMDWKEGSAEKVLLHGLIAGLMAEINGGKFGEGLTNGAINEMIIGLIANHQKDLGLTGADTRWISALIGGAISEGMGGSFGQGAGITDSATKNNYLTHKQQVDWHNAISLCETTECKDELTAYYNELDSRQTEWLISRLGLSEEDAQELRDKKGMYGSTFVDNLLEQEFTHPSDLKVPDKVKEYQNNASEIGNGNKGPVNDIKIPPTDKENWYMNDSDKMELYEKMLQDPTFMPNGIDEQYRYIVQKQLEAAIIAEETGGRVFIIYDKELTANELAYHRAITAMDASENGWLTSQHNVELTNAVGMVVMVGELGLIFESYSVYNAWKKSGGTSTSGVSVTERSKNVEVPKWEGSGPTSGVLGVNSNSVSNKAIQNYYPNEPVEFIFDSKTGTFVVGKPNQINLVGSPHEQLASSINAEGNSVVGGTFARGADGKIYTTENSGHFGRNWTPEIRTQFIEDMRKYGLEVSHDLFK